MSNDPVDIGENYQDRPVQEEEDLHRQEDQGRKISRVLPNPLPTRQEQIRVLEQSQGTFPNLGANAALVSYIMRGTRLAPVIICENY